MVEVEDWNVSFSGLHHGEVAFLFFVFFGKGVSSKEGDRGGGGGGIHNAFFYIWLNEFSQE